jgi:hypothetical protein
MTSNDFTPESIKPKADHDKPKETPHEGRKPKFMRLFDTVSLNDDRRVNERRPK